MSSDFPGQGDCSKEDESREVLNLALLSRVMSRERSLLALSLPHVAGGSAQGRDDLTDSSMHSDHRPSSTRMGRGWRGQLMSLREMRDNKFLNGNDYSVEE